MIDIFNNYLNLSSRQRITQAKSNFLIAEVWNLIGAFGLLFGEKI